MDLYIKKIRKITRDRELVFHELVLEFSKNSLGELKTKMAQWLLDNNHLGCKYVHSSQRMSYNYLTGEKL